jgi:hypothetical protein
MCHGCPTRFTVVNIYFCPSDPNSPRTTTIPGDPQGFHANYVGCAGSTSFNPGGAGGDHLNGIFYWKSKVTLQLITDGTSNTIMLSEIIISQDVTGHDVRGRMYNPARQGSVLFSTLYTPNNLGTPDRLQYCQSIPAAPCTSTISEIVLTARSYHTGIVCAAFGDGSVRTISNSINAGVYLAMGTRAGGEVATE